MPSAAAVKREIRSLFAPAPMQDFKDFDEYWETRGTIGPMRRWLIGADLIPDGSSVLDVGCGSGEFLEYLRSKRPNVRATGCDFSMQAVDNIRSLGFDGLVVDVSKEPLPETFDYITCFEVLEHIPNAEEALDRLMQSVRKQLIVSVPNVGYIGSRLRLGLFGRFPNTNCIFHVKEHVRHWTPKDFKEWVDRLGYRLVRSEGQYRRGRKFPGLFAKGMVYVLENKAPQ